MVLVNQLASVSRLVIDPTFVVMVTDAGALASVVLLLNEMVSRSGLPAMNGQLHQGHPIGERTV